MLTITEIAKKLRLDYQTIYMWVRQGRLPAIQVDKAYRINEADLAKFLEANKVKVKKEEVK
jgi:excisionase family DNA binding protein